MDLSINEKSIAYHNNMKAKNADYPKLPNSVAKLNKTSINQLTPETIKHINSLLLGFSKRVHNWNNSKLNAIPTPKGMKQQVNEVVESFWGE